MTPHRAVVRLAERNMTSREIAARLAARQAAPAVSLPGLAETINTACLRQNFPAGTLRYQQVLCLAEETGEFVGAYRRWAGLARRAGTWEDVTAELADVVISAYAAANVLGIDLDAAWRAKARVILTRGWRELPPPAA
jgi:NTP pyrophosphatase (non-canonical NTP hydrolase)